MEKDGDKPGIIKIQRQKTPQDGLEKWNKSLLSWGLKIKRVPASATTRFRAELCLDARMHPDQME
jgi:hypothetical protein